MKAALKFKLQHSLLAGFAATCISGFALAQAVAPPLEDIVRQGALAMHNGRVADAEKYFRQATQIAPQSADAHLDLGLVLGREGKIDEAITSLKTALQIDPKLSSANMFLGIFLHQANRQDEARAALQQEIDLNPKNVEALTWLGMVELSTGHPERAVVPFDRAAELAPDDLNVLEYRGRAHNLVARDSYARMAKVDPTSWHVHRVQAEIYSDEGRHTDAIAEYEAAIKQENHNPDLYEGLGDEYRKTSQLDAARRAYTRQFALSPQNPVAMYNLGSVDVELGNNADGVTLLEQMLKTYSNAPVAEYYLGRGLATLGKDEDAAEWLQKSIQGDPASEVAKRCYYELARLYRKMQRPVEARKTLAEYNRLREAQEKQSAKEIEDWRKLSNPTPSGSAPAENPKR